MTQRVVLAGNAITAQILHAYLAADRRYEVVGLTVDDEFVSKGGIAGLETIALSRLKEAIAPGDCGVVMAIGYDDLNRVRESVFGRLKGLGYAIETYVHPDARVHTREPLGEGCIVLPGAVIEPHARVGADTVIWTNVVLAHHCSVAEHCWIAAGTVVSGQARVERNSFVGVNATIVNDVTVGEYNLIGAAALVSRSTRPNSVHLARSAEPVRYPADDYVKYFKV